MNHNLPYRDRNEVKRAVKRRAEVNVCLTFIGFSQFHRLPRRKKVVFLVMAVVAVVHGYREEDKTCAFLFAWFFWPAFGMWWWSRQCDLHVIINLVLDILSGIMFHLFCDIHAIWYICCRPPPIMVAAPGVVVV